MNEYGIIDPHPEKCNHRVNSAATTVQILNNYGTMTVPKHYYGICKYCGKSFDYIEENGKFIPFKSLKNREGDK
jgi:hypothetical protein